MASYTNSGQFDATGSLQNAYQLNIEARTSLVAGGTLVEIFAEVFMFRNPGTPAFGSGGTRSWSLPGGRTTSTSGPADSSGSSTFTYDFSVTNPQNVYNYFNRYVPFSHGSSTTLTVTVGSGSGSDFFTTRTLSVNVPLFTQQANVTVPDLIGLGPGDAQILLTDLGLNPSEGATLSTTDPFLNNTVGSQSPAAGSSVAAGSTVTYRIYVYTEPTLTLPNVENLNVNTAFNQLANAGFTNITTTPSSTGATSANNLIVFDQDPEPGVSQTAGTLVNLDYYNFTATFPNVVGQYLSAATATIQATIFEDRNGISTSTRTTGATIANNRTVFSQNPAGNSAANIADPISLTLYDYRVTMPNLVGQTEANALTTLRNNGWEYTSNTTDFRRITINYITAGATGTNNGTVASQTPASGTTAVSVGTTATTINVYRVPGAGQRFTSPTARTLLTTSQRATGSNTFTPMTIRRVFKSGAWVDISNV